MAEDGRHGEIEAHLQPSKPTCCLSQPIHSEMSLFTKGWAWSMLGAASNLSPDDGPPVTPHALLLDGSYTASLLKGLLLETGIHARYSSSSN